MFKNKTDKPSLEVTVTNAMIKEFNSYSMVRLASSENANAILDGTITNFSIKPIATDFRDKVVEYRINMELEVSLRDMEETIIIYKRDDIAEFADFKAPRDSISRKREIELATERTAEELARRIVSEIFEGF